MDWQPPSSDPRLIVEDALPLGAEALESRLDELLDPVLSSRRTATAPAHGIAALARREQDFVLHWTGVIARTNPELAYQFAAAAPAALERLGLAAAEAWIIHSIDVYDREGLYRGSAALKNAEEYASLMTQSAHAVTFDEVAPVLRHFVCGLGGRALQVERAPRPCTDTETLFLPPHIALFDSRNANFLVYKAMAVMMWAQTRYGTFNADLGSACQGYPDPARALEILGELETMRLEARLATLLPGFAREIGTIRGSAHPCAIRCAGLAQDAAQVTDSLDVLGRVYQDFIFAPRCYEPVLRPDLAAAARAARVAREKNELRLALAQLLDESGAMAPHDDATARIKLVIDESSDALSASYRLQINDKTSTAPAHVARLFESIRQDFGAVPDDYLFPAGGGQEPSPLHHVTDASTAWHAVHGDQNALYYNEWDHRRRHYRKNWCMLRELDIQPGDPGFVTATLARHAPQVAQLRRTFEAMRGEDRFLKRQAGGDDIDLDAVVQAYTDLSSGLELGDRLHIARRKVERDLAVMFMVDMSGSTKGWVNDAERAALVMLCEALEVLGDRYGIYGFSGMTRKRCAVYRVKRFAEAYDEEVRGRIAGILPQDYTRMGVAIRHLSGELNRIEARIKLLITLSDGKPDDYGDNYRGEYGIEDTRQALIEARRTGIRAFCITIDHEARDYLPHMYGAANWMLVNDVMRLPLKVAETYRRLTA